MEFRIERMEIQNFKGIARAGYDFSDETRIYGQNATGKSSIVDAYTWLLFNRDAHGNAPGSDKFREKPLDKDGNEVHYLDTTVTGYFKLDGQPFVLKRTQRESWVKKRGNTEATYQGNGSTYWINDVETKATDYNARINAIASGNPLLFSLITSLGAFNAMDWHQRRATLISMSGVDVDGELLSRSEYANIAAEARKRNVSVDDLKKVLSDQKRDINRQLQLIPARIDENQHNMPEVTEQEIKDAEFALQEAQSSLDACDAMIARVNAGNDNLVSTYPQILQCESEIVSIKRDIQQRYDTEKRRLQSEVDAAKSAVRTLEASQRAATRTLGNCKAESEKASKDVQRAREDYRKAYAETFTPSEYPDVCPTCGQRVSDDAREKLIAGEKGRFDAKRAENLAAINKRGQELRRLENSCKADEQKAGASLQEAEAALNEAMIKMNAAIDALNTYPPMPDYSDPRIYELQTRIVDLKAKQHDSPDDTLRKCQERKAELQARIDASREVLGRKAKIAEAQKRIDELEAEQAELGQKRADIEVMIFDVEKFIADRCSLLEESINSHFSTVQWKLFDRQINGALVDCCECMIPGENALVPYSGANTAAKVNADIEIASAISEHYGVCAPIFFDNAESVNYIARPAGQLITLSVSDDPTLRVEQIRHDMKEVA